MFFQAIPHFNSRNLRMCACLFCRLNHQWHANPDGAKCWLNNDRIKNKTQMTKTWKQFYTHWSNAQTLQGDCARCSYDDSPNRGHIVQITTQNMYEVTLIKWVRGRRLHTLKGYYPELITIKNTHWGGWMRLNVWGAAPICTFMNMMYAYRVFWSIVV